MAGTLLFEFFEHTNECESEYVRTAPNFLRAGLLPLHQGTSHETPPLF